MTYRSNNVDGQTRFCSKAKIGETEECWPWLGYKTQKGYGVFFKKGTGNIRAHRFAYELWIAPIPEGLTIDHLCKQPDCVNPNHMEPVSISVNTLRGVGLAPTYVKRTHCNYGHPFDLFNTYKRKDNSRRCRTCEQIREKKRIRQHTSAGGK